MKSKLIYLCFLALFFSCSSDDDNNTATTTESNFYGLAVGNSWNYKIYQRNSQTQTLQYNGIQKDVTVVGTVNLNDNVFYKLKEVTSGSTDNDISFPNGEVFILRRIEGGVLMDEYNQHLFVNNDFTERLVSEQSWGNYYNRTLEELATIEVDAGEFTCTEMLVYVINTSGVQLPGLDHHYYADGIGLVSSSVSFVTSGELVYKTVLNSYNIQ